MTQPQHLADAEKIRTEIYRNMTPSQKLAEVQKLRDLAWAIKAAAIREKHPGWEEEKVQEEVRKIFLYAVT